jgi:tetratricopeptide (TPR) repeat protein
LLDSIYEALGKSSERVSLAEQRLEHCSDIAERIPILITLMTTAEACGFNDRASAAVKSLLRLDPANIAYLKAATEIFIKSGDLEALREAREAIEDLGSGSVAGPVERLIQASELALMAGLLEDASQLLIRLAGIDPRAAVVAAVGALAVQGKGSLELMLPVIRQAASASPGVGKQTEVAAILFKAAERMLDTSVEVALPLLEMAVFLDPDNVSAVMTLAAVYESMGMAAESESLLANMN